MSAKIKKKKEAVFAALALAEGSLIDYRALILENDTKNEYSPATFHQRWSSELLKGKKNKAIQGFRGCGKTQYVMRAYPLHRLQFPREECNYIVLIKQNTNQARKALKSISREYQSNPLASANLVKVIEDSGEVLHALVLNTAGEEMEVRIEAYGKGQALRGASWVDKRPDVVIIDDPQDREDARSETILENDWEWFLSDIKFLGAEAGSRIFFIGNNLGEKSLAERILNNPNELQFETERLPRLLDNGKCAWPERDKPEEIEELKANYAKMGRLDIYYEEVMCRSISEENKIFHEDDYRYFALETIEEGVKNARAWRLFCTLDPASSTRSDACYRAFVVNAVNSDGYWHIIDVRYGRWDSAELLDVMFALVRRWRLRSVGIEKGHYEQVIKPFLHQKQVAENTMFDIIPLEHAKQGTKLERIKMLGPRIKAHQVLFDQTGEWLPEMKAELAGVTKDSIKSLYIDLVDALAMQDQIAQAPIIHQRQDINKLRRAKSRAVFAR